jgi:hypothetical protein
MRVKEDLNLYVTSNIFVSDKKIGKIIEENISSIEKMYDKQIKRYTEIHDLTSIFQQDCRKYIYRLIEKPEA